MLAFITVVLKILSLNPIKCMTQFLYDNTTVLNWVRVRDLVISVNVPLLRVKKSVRVEYE